MRCLLFVTYWFVLTISLVRNDYVIDVDDILSANYMPTSLLTLENPEEVDKKFYNKTINFRLDNDSILEGNFDKAFETMGFHRKMMNEYLCRNFIAEQIVADMTITRIKRRLGTEDTKDNMTLDKMPVAESLRNNLIEDEGSSNYKNWLSKSTTLEDIYRHYENNKKEESDSEEERDEELYDTNVAGYGYQNKHSSKLGHVDSSLYGSGGGYSYPGPAPVQPLQYPGLGEYATGHVGGSFPLSHGSSEGHGGYEGPPLAHGGEYHEHVPKYYEGHEKGKDLTDLFDIALTALAYLSFGMFLIQLIMCISLALNPTTTAANMAMSMNPTGDGGGMMTGDAEMVTSSDMMGMGMTGNEGDIDAGKGTMKGEGMGTKFYHMGGKVDKTGQGTDTLGGMGEMMGGSFDTTDDDHSEGEDPNDEGNFHGGESTEGNTGETIGFAGMESVENEEEEEVMEDSNTSIQEPDNEDEEVETQGDASVSGMSGVGGQNNVDDYDSGGDGTGEGEDEISEYDQGFHGGGSTGDGDVSEPTADASSGTGTGTDGGDNMTFRLKRDLPLNGRITNQDINELARRVLVSIEAALVAPQDGGNCLRKTLCENNKYSRSLKDRNKIWLPVWSLGMSWLSGKLSKNVRKSTAIIDSIKASILGLGKANCDVIYQECNLKKEREIRRRRRKRRSV